MKKPSEEISELINLLAKLSKIVGVDVFRAFFLNRRFVFMNIFMAIWLSSMIYPVYAEWPNVLPMLTSLTHITLFFVTGIRMHRHISDVQYVSRNRDRLMKYHQKYENDETISELLRARVRQLKIFGWTLGILYANYYSIHLYFFIFFLITGKHQLAVPVRVPFTDPETDFGYFLTFLTCHVVASYGLFVFTSYDAYFVIFGAHTAVMVDVMNHKLKMISAKLRENMNENLREKFVEVINDFQEYKAHLSEFSNYFQTNNVFSIFTTTFAICFNVLLVLGSSNKFQSAIGILSTSHIFLFCLLPCAMGTFIDNQNEGMFKSICNIPWYGIPPNLKKIYLQFVAISQNVERLHAAIIGEFSLELLTTILNSCYSYFMFIWNMAAK